jgi:hypothetical protein
MKKMLFLFALLSFLVITANQAFAISISLVPSTPKIQPGDNIFVDINISGLHETFSSGNQVDSVLAAFSLDFLYDPSLLTFLAVPPAGWGPHLGDVHSGEATGFVDEFTPGVLSLDLVSLLDESATNCVFCVPPYLDNLQRVDPTDSTSPYLDTFRLATLGFYAPYGGNPGLPSWPSTSPSRSTVFGTSNVVLSDPDGFEVSLLDASGNPIGPAPVSTPFITVAVPEPGTIALMSLGLIGINFIRKYRQAAHRG